MRHQLLLFISFFGIISCSRSPESPAFYGGAFDTTQAIGITELALRMEGQDKIETVIYGTIQESCQSEGCWMNLVNEGGGNSVFVDWDHKFNTPLSITGRRAIATGYAYIDSTSGKHAIAFKANAVHL